MLFGIIKDNKHEYYFDYSKEKKKISITLVFHSNVSVLSKDEVRELLNKVFCKPVNLSFLRKENGYDIYLDLEGNERYYKDDVEDFSLFFLKNGSDALLYTDNEKNDNVFSKVKRYCLSGKPSKIEMVFVLGTSMYIGHILRSNIDEWYNMARELTYKEVMTLDSAHDLIENASSLTRDEKNLLYNEELLKKVLDVGNSDRDYVLKCKLSDIHIETFPDENLHFDGYYNTLRLNEINIGDSLDKELGYYYDVLIHEYVHLLQNYSKYHYIKEACAEIFKEEYYGFLATEYDERVLRTKVLMEIIGPEPVLECNFGATDEKFEGAIKQYLNENDANDLLKCFCLHSSVDYKDPEEAATVNKQIDDLLAKMYFNKTGNSIETNEIIKYLYAGVPMTRYYFNDSKQKYFDSTTIEINANETYAIKLNDFVIPENIDKINLKKDFYIFDKDYLDSEGIRYEIEPYFVPNDGVEYKIDSDCYVYDGKEYSTDEALADGLVVKGNRYYSISEIDDVSIDDLESNHFYLLPSGQFTILCKNGITMDGEVFANGDFLGAIHKLTIKVPSVHELFYNDDNQDYKENSNVNNVLK